MKLLFRRLFSYCAMVILLSFLTLLSSLSIGMLECVNNFSVTTTFHTRCKQVQSYAPAVLCYKSLRRLLYVSRCCQRENIILQLRSILDYNAYVLRMRIHTRGCHPTTVYTKRITYATSTVALLDKQQFERQYSINYN